LDQWQCIWINGSAFGSMMARAKSTSMASYPSQGVL